MGIGGGKNDLYCAAERSYPDPEIETYLFKCVLIAVRLSLHFVDFGERARPDLTEDGEVTH